MKRFILSGLFFGLCLIARSQPVSGPNGKFRITGRVMDSASGKVLDYATVTVFSADNPKPVNGGTTNEKGLFTIAALPAGDYKVVIDYIGHRSMHFDHVVVNDKTPGKNLGDVLISGKSQTLEGVTVTAPAGLIENRIDKMVYNAEKDISSQGGVATDVLRKVPQVSVDVDGNVELQGSSNVRFLIDGRPSTIFGNNLADALQSIPASQIKSIEVITSPGARYDAEGTGGIINIILKKSNVRGINGNITLSAGTRLQNGSLNLNARKGSFGLHGFFSGNGQLTSTTLNDLNRTSFDSAAKSTTRLLQNGNSDFTRNGYETGLGFDWNMTPKDNLSGSVSYDHFANKNRGYTNQEQRIQAEQTSMILSDIFSLRNSENRSHSGSLDWDMAYKKTFKEDQELSVSYSSSYGNNQSAYYQYQRLVLNNAMFAGTKSNNPGKEQETNINIDYTQPLGENSNFEAGGKTELRHFNSNAVVNTFNPASLQYVYDARQSNALAYKRSIYAAYAAVSFRTFNFLDIKAGGRYERTETMADYSNAHTVNIPGYNTFVPSVYLSHKLNDVQVIKIGYSRRIQRPGYRALNPFVNAVDPKNITTGNPNLKPELADNIEASYSTSFDKGGSLNMTLFHRRNSQDIQPYIVYYPQYLVGDSIYTNVSVSTSENIGLEKNTGLSFYGSVPLGSAFNVRSNFTLFHRNIINRFVAGNTTTSVNYRINLNATYQFSPGFIGEFFGNFSSARNEVQGRMPSFTSYNLALRKQILKKKGSIAFTTTNPFNKYVNQATALKGPNFTLNSLRRLPYRSFGISFNYKFGKLEFKKEKEDNLEQGAPPDAN